MQVISAIGAERVEALTDELAAPAYDVLTADELENWSRENRLTGAAAGLLPFRRP
ncbi:hypothetical protein JOF29_003475 [Kribbella aluminosa]|uniref:Uncharacterized protein n=1 Tax=Kribbella aluminosa TaxID=416017 RepID=A0ABS4UL68_9ACTN|nr:hypothetical protein [Kribbella aluminosa]MBP2352392.1 hypothetical protein [Kribbella aluminosa]